MIKMRGFEQVITEKLKNNKEVKLPFKATKGSAGNDFITPIDIELKIGEKVAVWTDVKAYMLEDEVLQIFPRSSLGIKGIQLMNTVGIIDSTYYSNENNDGNIGVVLVNRGTDTVVIKAGDRFCQGIFSKYLSIDGENENDLKERTGGFGSTN